MRHFDWSGPSPRRTFDPPRRKSEQREIYSLRLILADESHIGIALLRNKQGLVDLADGVGPFLGIRVVEEYDTGYQHEGVRSPGLTERQFEDRMRYRDPGAAKAFDPRDAR